jgi:peptide methionine sulfoxide reductase msrA/msrB
MKRSVQVRRDMQKPLRFSIIPLGRVSYQELLDIFWRNIEPTMLNRQFVDFGTQYRAAIFYHNEDQRRLAEVSKEALEKSGKFYKPIVTEIKSVSTFYKAEEYHQQYYKKNPFRYEFYDTHSGRSHYLKAIWSSERNKKLHCDRETRNSL